MTFPDVGEVRHPFYDDSSELFAVIQKNAEHGIGITTDTVLKKAYSTMGKAIMDTINEVASTVEPDFEMMSVAWNMCETKMKKLQERLTVVTVSPLESFPIYDQVKNMYEHLSSKRKDDTQMKTMASSKARMLKGVSKGYRNTQYDMHLSKIRLDNYQLDRLYKTPASFNDTLILAEAATLRKKYAKEKGEGFRMYIASCDSNNFCPAKCSFGISTAVTDQILTEFKLICNWPRTIADTIR